MADLPVRPPWPAALAISAIGWLGLWPSSRAVVFAELCSALFAPGARVTLFLTFNPLAPALLGWLAMLLAMLPLFLARPLRAVRLGALRRNRIAVSAGYAAGYVMPWLAVWPVALVLTGLIVAVPAPLMTAVFLAVVWHVSPWRQRCLNACHRQPALRAFGTGALTDAVRLDASNGAWCVPTCLPLMLVPMQIGAGHVIAMIAVGLILAFERQLPPRASHWIRGLERMQRPLRPMWA